MPAEETGTGRAAYWDDVYAERGAESVSWFQPEPALSLELIEVLGVDTEAPVVDIGGGASRLVDRLAHRGFKDLTVLDLSARALELARHRLGPGAPVAWVEGDVLAWEPERLYGLWHDRAVFHFLTDPADTERYVATLTRALRPGGALVMATFAPDGPEYCSGLPVSRYDADMLRRTLGDRFEVVTTRRELHVTPSGATQPFTWIACRLR